MKKDEAVQTMIDELWLLGLGEEKANGGDTMQWLEHQFKHPDANIDKSRLATLFVMHTEYVRKWNSGLKVRAGKMHHPTKGRVK